MGDVEVSYKRFSDSIRETMQISGPIKEDIYVTVSHSPLTAVFIFSVLQTTGRAICCGDFNRLYKLLHGAVISWRFVLTLSLLELNLE